MNFEITLFVLSATLIIQSGRCQSPGFCEENHVRLVDGSTQYEGRVEICKDNVWGTVCDDLWDTADAQVVCTQLGYRRDGAIARIRALFGRGTGPILMDNVVCAGSEDLLINCPHITNHNCGHHEDAGVICLGDACQDGAVRLVDGRNEGEGRVEVCLNQDWGTVCDDLWDNTDATVVCAQLGFSIIGAQSFQRAQFGRGSGDIWLDDVTCRGTESRLVDCPYDSSTRDCSHFEDASVRCNTDLVCSDGEVRLTGGDTALQGRVEVCQSEVWGTVCDDAWSDVDSMVVCRQLGFPTDNVDHSLRFGPGTGPIFIDNANCVGTESRLVNCNYDRHTEDCSHNEDVGVICRDFVCVDGEIRLAGEGRASDSEGRVEVCVDNVWGTVCDDSWGSTDARVVCLQLGFSRFGAVAHPSAEYGLPEGLPIVLDEVQCSGTEKRLIDCRHFTSHDCSQAENAGVECTESLLCSNGDVRLASGGTSGAVEVCWDESWGSICDADWTVSDAQVTCIQLGFSRTDARPLTSGFVTPSGPALLANVSCTGSEMSIVNCSHTLAAQADTCEYHVGVACSQSDCSDWDVRLVDGSSLSEGRVEVCFNEQWGSVCDDFWGTSNALVVCSQLGFTSNITAFGFRNAYYGEGNDRIWLDDVRCSGSESSLQDCSHRTVGAHNCDHSEDAGVRCSQCTEHDLRLSGGTGPNQGSVEVCLRGSWGRVCQDHWTTTEAAVVCAQLGLPHQGAEAASGQSVDQGMAPVWLSNVDCSGSETHLTLCSYSTGPLCGEETVAAVVCHKGPPSPPESISFISVTSSSVSVVWSVVRGNELQSEPEYYELNCTLDIGSVVATVDDSVLRYELSDLSPWTMYQCCVRASSERDFGAPTCGSFQTLESAPNAPPQSVQGLPVSSTSLLLMWSPPPLGMVNGEIREYTVLIEVLDVSQVLSYITQDTILHVSGLHPFYVHQCTVAASTVAPGPYSSPVSLQTFQDVPSGPPQSVSADATSTTDVVVSWLLPVVHHRNGIIIGYNVGVVEASNGDQQTFDVSNQLSHSLSSLGVFTRYFISVAARTVNGTGPSSSPIEVQTLEAAPTRAPRNLRIDNLTPHSVELGWRAPPNGFLNGIVRGYSVVVLRVETSSVVQSINTTSRSLTLQGLHPNYSYLIQVACVTVDVGPYAQLSVTMPIAAPSGSPVDIQVSVSVDISAPSAYISWSPPPLDEQNGPITGYSLELTRLDIEDTLLYSTTDLHYTVSPLTPNAVYSVVIRASTSAGYGPTSELHFFNTRTGVPIGSPRSLGAQSPVGSSSITFTWLPVLPDLENGIVSGYILELTDLATNTLREYNTTTTRISVWNLHPYHTYTARVAAFTENGLGPFSETFTQTTGQDVPSGYPGALRAVSVSSREVTLTWQPVASTEANGVIVEYVVTAVKANSNEELSFTTTELSLTVTTEPYSTYMFSVAASTVVGTGPFSTEILVETPEEAPSHHPQSVHVEDVEARSLTLTWVPPPEQYHHGVIREYNIRVLDLQSDEERLLTSSTTRITVMDLHPYYYYNCSVSAVTVDEGPHSSFLLVRTAEDAPSGPPLGLQVTGVSARGVVLEWDQPQPQHRNGVIRKYVVQLSDGSLTNVTSRQASMEGLNPNSEYTVQVAAFTVSRGPFSNSLPLLTLEDVPESPPRDMFHEATGPRTLSISWLPPLSSNGVITQYSVVLVECDTPSVRVEQVQHEHVQWQDLHPFYVYKYSIAGSTAVGQGPFSQNTTVQMPEAAPTGPPLNIRITEVGQSSVLVEWDPPSVAVRNGRIRYYVLSLSDSSGLDEDVSVSGPDTSYSFMVLRAGNAYTVSVAAVTVYQGPSDEVSFTTLEDAPGSPVNVAVSVQGPRSVGLSWSPPPEHLRNGLILNYNIAVIQVSPPTKNQPVYLETTDLEIIVDSLHPAWSYEFSVSAVTSVGRGDSVSVLGTLLEDAPSAPPMNFSWTSPSPTTLLLSWQPPPDEHHNGVISEYQLIVTELESGRERSWSLNANSYVVEMLRPFNEYSCSVAAFTNALGPSTTIRLRQPEDVPGRPGSLEVNHTSPYSSLVQWSSVPPALQHGVVTSYIVQALSSVTNQTHRVGPHVFSYEFVDLESYTVYNFSVYAVTSAGVGHPITHITRTLLGAPSFTPTISGVSRISPTEVEVSWESPQDQTTPEPGVLFLVRYREVETRVARNTDDLASVQEVTGTGAVISGLDPQLEYAVSVAAKNQVGVGDYSDESIASVYESSRFQLHLYGPIVCLPWISIGVRDKMDVVSQVISQVLLSSCNCSFSAKFIALTQMRCGDQSTDRLIFEASLVSTLTENSAQLRTLVQDWVHTEPTVVVHGVQLQVAPCSVLPAQELLCYVSPTLPAVTSGLVQSATLYYVVGAAVGGMVLLICVTLVVIFVVVAVRRMSSKKARRQLAVRNPMELAVSFTTTIDDTMGDQVKCDKQLESEGDYYETEHIYDEPSNCINTSFAEKILCDNKKDDLQVLTVNPGDQAPRAAVEAGATYSEVGIPDKPAGQYSQLNVAEMPRLQYNNIGTSHILENDYDAPPSRGTEFPQLKPTAEGLDYETIGGRSPYENVQGYGSPGVPPLPLTQSATAVQLGNNAKPLEHEEYVKMSSPKY